MKIIQISSNSLSFFLDSGKGDLEKIIMDDWFAQVARKLKHYYPQLEIECWNPEKMYKKEQIKHFENVKFRIFPSSFAVRHGMELCWPMIDALKKEIKNASDEDKKLILHFHEYHSWQCYLMLLFLKKNKNVRVFGQHHGGRSPLKNLKKYPRLFLFFPAIALMQFCENLLFKKVDTFYSLGDEEINYVKKIAPKSRVKFQTMGIEDKYFRKASKNLARKKLGLKQDKKYVLYLGRIKTTKGIKELLDAIKNIDAELLLIGQGQDSGKYQDYIKQKNINNAKFLGAIYGDKKLDYLSACDCLILPSHTEGAPVVLMEAIAKNLPVIATNVGGINKMIKDKREGIIIRPKSKESIFNAINEILKWKPTDIREYAQRYKWKNIAEETVKDYQI